MNFLPRYLSKYYPDNLYSVKALENNEIYFAPLSSFNDPFENVLRIKPLPVAPPGFVQMTMEGTFLRTEKELGEWTNEYVSQLKHTAMDVWGISCFTIDPYNFLMWSHYAASHTGFCLIYFVHKDYAFFRECERVDYHDDQPIVEIGTDKTWKQFIDVIWTKATVWKYEQEFRMRVDEIGPVRYNPEALATVIFGCRMSETRRAELAEIIYSKYPQVTILCAGVHPTLYTLEFREYKTGELKDIKVDIDYERGTNKDGTLGCIAHLGYPCYCAKCKPGTTADYWVNQPI